MKKQNVLVNKTLSFYHTKESFNYEHVNLVQILCYWQTYGQIKLFACNSLQFPIVRISKKLSQLCLVRILVFSY